MASFAYRGRNADGATVNGRVEAPNLDAAAAELSDSRIVPIDIKPVEDSVSGVVNLRQIFASERITEVELITFARQMHNLTKAGLPLDRSIRGLQASIANPALKRVLSEVISSLQRGNTLADSLAQHPKVFSELFVSLVSVGENTGRLGLSFKELAKYIEIERTTEKQLKSATRYPAFVLLAMAAALVVITIFVIPAFDDVFNRLGSNLPWQTRVLIEVSYFSVTYWPVILGLILISFGFFRYWRTTRFGEVSWDRIRLRLPLVGSIFERIALARFAKTFAIMGRSGVPIVRSLNLVSEVVGNKYIGRKISGMSQGVTRGESLYLTAERSQIFLPLVLQMIAVGEESGNLPDLLDEVAEFYDGEVEYDLNRLTEAIEPILISFMAFLVLVLALGVFLPIWDLGASGGA